ncbi:hypothetical protein [Mucilaginibacter flavidus]|uniref:hypothetical protein n=1 Tax=Mucilaginibacter flavidus TaxID=2949309 RepID=UPI0020934A65|nr:hypothetical protein [Mucilaginibacter flavidus]MCO5947876.1 hypothetical protein [Mucilaginibacter flavidus]
MLQNRVDPQGNIITTSARGAWLGNRGQLHGKGKTILRPFKHKAWIICVLQFKNRHRQVMSAGLWTELFFLDEATAFAAGHRPCFECRREHANRFKSAWLKGNPGYGFYKKTSINKFDDILQGERIDANNEKVTFEADINDLPDGTFVQLDDEPYLISNHLIHHWTPFGYDKTASFLSLSKVTVLTPKSTVAAFRAGYRPQLKIDS